MSWRLRKLKPKTYAQLFGIFSYLAVILWLYLLTPEQIIAALGIQNSYLLLFVMAFIGGISTFVVIPYVFVMVGLAFGGLDPFVLGFIAATGEALGDCTSYWLGRYMSGVLPPVTHRWLDRLITLYSKKPRLLPLFCFCYGAFIPFSNDFVTIPMGMSRYSFWKTMLPLWLGNIVYNTGVTLIALYVARTIGS